MRYICFSVLLTAMSLHGEQINQRTVEEIKADLIARATAYMGQGDPDFTIQRELDELVAELLEANPQPPVAERLPLLEGTWQQLWGAYDYQSGGRQVDDNLKVDEIYQVVDPGGFYYNVAPLWEKDGKTVQRIALLRGEYRPVEETRDQLRVRFTRYPGNKGRPADKPIWELAELAEKRELPDKTTIVPTLIVRLFFGGGILREVYTDETLRLTYGSDGKNFEKDHLYVMVRVE